MFQRMTLLQYCSGPEVGGGGLGGPGRGGPGNLKGAYDNLHCMPTGCHNNGNTSWLILTYPRFCMHLFFLFLFVWSEAGKGYREGKGKGQELQ